MKISSNIFILSFALFITLLNYKFFEFAINKAGFYENKIVILTLPVLFFALLIIAFSLLFLPYLTKPLSIFIGISGIAGAYFMNTYGTIIDSDMIRNAVQTDVKEVKDLLNWDIILWILGAVFVVIIVVKTKIIYSKVLHEIKIRSIFIVAALAIFGASFGIFSKNFIPFFRNYPEIRFFTTPFYPIYSIIKFTKSLTPKAEFQKIGLDATLKDDKKRLFVLVVGETARAANYSLNNYMKNDTNPYSKENGVLSFTNFYSCGTSTAISVPCMFSNLTKKTFSPSKANNTGNLLDVFTVANIDVSWFGNNSGWCKGVCDRLQNAKNYGGEGFDEVMLKDINSKIQNASKNSFIVVHLQGSHGPTYFKRYPKEFDKFNPACDTAVLKDCTHDEIVNTYDNTILYTDYVMNKIINMLKDSKFETGLLYVSDHGESLGENGLYLHGMPYAFAPDFQIHVPAILWLNDNKKLDELSRLKDENLSQDYVFHSMLGFFSIDSNVYDNNLDLFAKDIK